MSSRKTAANKATAARAASAAKKSRQVRKSVNSEIAQQKRAAAAAVQKLRDSVGTNAGSVFCTKDGCTFALFDE
ncbi:hypothetical protein H7B90_03660 [Cohnella xylanilytica]|uniref:Uncharacterized protein n=1 Tax=Cohnella xylanilytica TaxID=557555 RepID=A0A841TU96_9BACL|nr:hypothetical protein [Cohnella xylanilytica]MBB6690492.1 hypothetical protein [Cohnella xylanilytica]